MAALPHRPLNAVQMLSMRQIPQLGAEQRCSSIEYSYAAFRHSGSRGQCVDWLSPPHVDAGGITGSAADLVTTDAAVADAGDSLSQPSPTAVSPIDVSNFFVTVSMGIGKPQPAGLKLLFPSLPHHLRHRVTQPLLPFSFPRDSTAEKTVLCPAAAARVVCPCGTSKRRCSGTRW